jgi:hypothetical protein
LRGGETEIDTWRDRKSHGERRREREKDFKELAHIINGAVKSEIYRTGHRLETNKS